eukprot:3481739-Pyramimonas_sp.AAC.1
MAPSQWMAPSQSASVDGTKQGEVSPALRNFLRLPAVQLLLRLPRRPTLSQLEAICQVPPHGTPPVDSRPFAP